MDDNQVKDIANLYDRAKAFHAAWDAIQGAEIVKAINPDDPSAKVIGHLASHLFSAIAYIDVKEGRV